MTIYCKAKFLLFFYAYFLPTIFEHFKSRKWVNEQEKGTDRIPIAFDMEWPFTFQTGPGKTAVIQLCANVGLCYVFHVAELAKLPAVLVQLLTHDNVCLHGVNVKK